MSLAAAHGPGGCQSADRCLFTTAGPAGKGRAAFIVSMEMESISNVLFSHYRDTPYHGEWVVAFLQGAWAGMLGDKIAGVCRPAALRGRELVVEVDDGAWLSALSSMKTELLARICRVAGQEVRELSFVLREAAQE